MKRFIGIDPHIASCTIAVVSETGRRLSEQVVETNGEALLGAIRSVPGERHVCIEEGHYSQWLYELLAPRVATCTVAQARWEPGNKSDAIDAHGWADKLRKGDITTPVYKDPLRYTKLRALCQVQSILSADVTRTKNRIKGFYRARGIKTPGRKVYSEARRSEWVTQLPTPSAKAIGYLYETLTALLEQKRAVEKELLIEAKRYPIAKLLQTIPGIGPLRAAQLLVMVMTPHRFRSVRQFRSYCGLGIVMRTSSDWVDGPVGGPRFIRGQKTLTRGLNRKRNPQLKSLIKGATLTAITTNTPLRTQYTRLVEAGTKPNLAQLTIARKIAALVLVVWKTQEAYDPAR